MCSLGASDPIGGVGCSGSAILDILSAERGAVPTSTLTPIPPGWEKPDNTNQTNTYIGSGLGVILALMLLLLNIHKQK